MRFLNVFLVFAVFVAAAMAYHIEDEPVMAEDEGIAIEPRVTCDLLGDERACAAHCILKGFRGGWCDSRKVCNCRR